MSHYVLAGNRASGLDATANLKLWRKTPARKNRVIRCRALLSQSHIIRLPMSVRLTTVKMPRLLWRRIGTKHQPKKSDYTAATCRPL